jgi:hypothetical protein
MAKYIKTENGYKTVSEIDNVVTIDMIGNVEDDINDVKATKIDMVNPVGTGSFSMNRKAETTVGIRSSTFGTDCIASGIHSHAEGYSTTASDSASHAEGTSTTASGISSHTEGSYNTASGHNSHAEGNNTTASGDSSHAEGSCTTASGSSSHAEGHYTCAQSKNQHAQGEYNILDTEGTVDTRGKYAHIVGNGTEAARSNAHTLDWNGNAWFQGDVYVGSTSGTDKDAGSVKLASETYVATAVDTAIAGITAITTAEIDEICGASIYAASEVTF